MYTLHIANKNYSSWSLRPWVLLQQLGIAFHEERHSFQADLQAQRRLFSAFSPTAKVPVLQDGQTTVWDSLAIAEYLAERHPQVWPQDPLARAWARSAACEMHAGFAELRERCGMNCVVRAKPRSMTVELKADIDRLNTLFMDGLSRFGGPFLAGKAFTAADAMFAPVVFRIQTYGLPMQPLAAGYVSHVLALPAMQQWYAQALAETDIDQSHEEDVLRYNDVIQDERSAGLR